MTHPTETTCWADPLSRSERRELARMLARHCKRSFDASHLAAALPAMHELAGVSAEMAVLHLDVTERAEVATS